MRGIVVGRWIGAGLVAGVVYVAAGVGSHFLFGSHLRMELRPMGATALLARHVGVRLLFGLVTVFLYAAVRPRFGPGLGSAAVAGVVVYLLAYAPLLNAFDEMGVLGGAPLVGAGLWGLAEALAAAGAGAWVYGTR